MSTVRLSSTGTLAQLQTFRQTVEFLEMYLPHSLIKTVAILSVLGNSRLYPLQMHLDILHHPKAVNFLPRIPRRAVLNLDGTSSKGLLMGAMYEKNYQKHSGKQTI
ncbi:hypothetical protein RF11_08513 [Thelohanellus kitauei]|uniref:Uncharacterized protein n=1 Tax=Thelohanellus kitauei TaxID=669202 RepID=A0A0C2NDE3_THEKT|nr:hypothetical protein RF11_08513 [Thelohanellus kitauei]